MTIHYQRYYRSFRKLSVGPATMHMLGARMTSRLTASGSRFTDHMVSVNMITVLLIRYKVDITNASHLRLLPKSQEYLTSSSTSPSSILLLTRFSTILARLQCFKSHDVDRRENAKSLSSSLIRLPGVPKTDQSDLSTLHTRVRPPRLDVFGQGSQMRGAPETQGRL